MVNIGIITEKVAGIVKAELSKLKVECKALTKEGIPIEKESRKAKAFQLFGDGRRPSDPEVKSLGFKPNSAYRYFQAWKQAQKSAEA